MKIRFRTPGRFTWTWAVLLATSLAGCGGGGGDPSAPAPPPPSTAAAATLPPLGPPVSLDDNHPVGGPYWPDGATATGGHGQPAAGLTCGDVPTGYHAHVHLSIMLNGSALMIPASVGILPATSSSAGCEYPLHTHDNSGRLHMHATAPATFTLGQFFQLWGQPLSSTNVAGVTSLPVAIFVTDNGNVTRYNGDPAAIELVSHREITIQIGSPIAAIPNFTWTGP